LLRGNRDNNIFFQLFKIWLSNHTTRNYISRMGSRSQRNVFVRRI